MSETQDLHFCVWVEASLKWFTSEQLTLLHKYCLQKEKESVNLTSPRHEAQKKINSFSQKLR